MPILNQKLIKASKHKSMKTLLYLVTLVVLLPFHFNLTAQITPKKTADQVLNNERIESQFDYLIIESGKFQDYKVVKKVWLERLKSNTIDTLKTLTTQLNSTNQQITSQQSTINGLEESLENVNQNLTKVTEEKDSLSFLGIAMTKSSYKTFMWSVVGILVLLLIFFIFKFKNSNTITVQAKKALAEIETEFEDHRRRALEREQKVMRKLQDEINKQRKANSNAK